MRRDAGRAVPGGRFRAGAMVPFPSFFWWRVVTRTERHASTRARGHDHAQMVRAWVRVRAGSRGGRRLELGMGARGAGERGGWDWVHGGVCRSVLLLLLLLLQLLRLRLLRRRRRRLLLLLLGATATAAAADKRRSLLLRASWRAEREPKGNGKCRHGHGGLSRQRRRAG